MSDELYFDDCRSWTTTQIEGAVALETETPEPCRVLKVWIAVAIWSLFSFRSCCEESKSTD
jgi:hypothetical protein